jgi:hypothetical protein
MQHGGSLEYQFVAASLREMIRDLARVASSPPAEAMAASYHIRNLRGAVLLWYFGGGTALYWSGHGASCRCLASGLLGSIVPNCCGNGCWRRWFCSGGGGYGW